MSLKLRYRDSSGEIFSEPSEDFLRAIIERPDASRWARATTGDSVLDFYEGAVKDEPHGFFIYYDLEFVPLLHDTALADENFVVHYVGGEPMHVPTICYRNKSEAWEIITHFIRSRGKLDKFKWVRRGDIDYKRDYGD